MHAKQDPSVKLLTEEQINQIKSLNININKLEIIRGAFHQSFTRLKVLLVDGSAEDYTSAMISIAEAIGWHYYPSIDGVECIVKQINRSTTRGRWKRNHKKKGIDPSISQKKNSEYFEFQKARFEKIKSIIKTKTFMQTLSAEEKHCLYRDYNRIKRIKAYED
jgi:hypothetical protein